MKFTRTALLLTIALALPASAGAQEGGPPERPDTRQVMFVGNNWDGTADVIDAHTFQRLARINVIPDREERMAEINRDPERLAFFLAIRQAVGEGNDQFTDDMFSSHDGRFVYVSRPSFADVVGIDLKTHAIVWRFPMEGQRADHMAISPDGTQILVSDSTANKVHRIDVRDREEDGRVPVGRLAAREQLLGRRKADLPRVDRPGLHADRRPAARAGPRHEQGRALLPDRRREHAPGTQALGHGRQARAGRPPGHGVSGAPDGAGARRPLRVLPGLVLPRLRGVRPAGGPRHARWPTCRSARRQRARRASSTCSTRRTTGWRSTTTGPSCASPARCPTTPRSSGATRSCRGWSRRREALLVDERAGRDALLGLLQRRRHGRRLRLRDRASRSR